MRLQQTKKLMEQTTSANEILRAYKDAFKTEEVKAVEFTPLTESDLQNLMTEFERDSEYRLHRLVNIIFELYYQAKDREDLEDVISLMESIIESSVKNADLESVVDILKKVKIVMGDGHTHPEAEAFLKRVINYAGSPGIIRVIGGIMDSGVGFEEDVLNEFIKHLDKNAIQSFIDVLGELQNIRSRKTVINILKTVGPGDMDVLLKSLHDRRWYLVRNIVYIIRLMGAKEAVGHLIKLIRHSDTRVKKEIIKTLGEMRSPQAVSVIKEYIGSPENDLRLAAVRAIRHIRTEDTKQILIQQIMRNDFIDRDYEEKKEFFGVLSLWRSKDVAELLINIFKRKAIFKRSKNYETLACAAYALGLIGDKKNLPLLKRYADSGSSFFKGHVQNAIRRLEGFHGRNK